MLPSIIYMKKYEISNRLIVVVIIEIRKKILLFLVAFYYQIDPNIFDFKLQINILCHSLYQIHEIRFNTLWIFI